MEKYAEWVEIGGGMLGGIAGLGAGAFLGMIFAPPNEFGDLIGVVLGMVLGYALGVGIGMGLAAWRLRRHRRPWLAPLGSLVGLGLVLLLSEPLHLNAATGLLLGSIALVAPAAAFFSLRFERRPA